MTSASVRRRPSAPFSFAILCMVPWNSRSIWYALRSTASSTCDDKSSSPYESESRFGGLARFTTSTSHMLGSGSQSTWRTRSVCTARHGLFGLNVRVKLMRPSHSPTSPSCSSIVADAG